MKIQYDNNEYELINNIWYGVRYYLRADLSGIREKFKYEITNKNAIKILNCELREFKLKRLLNES